MHSLDPDSTFYRPMHYILDHIPSLAAMSIYDLAEQSFVSTSTISRLCKELGFKNYQEFKIQTYACYRRLADSDELLYPTYIGSNHDTNDKMIDGALTYLDYCQIALTYFLDFARGDGFAAHMKLLRDADTIVLYSPIKRDMLTLARRLILRGKSVRTYSGDISDIITRCNADSIDWVKACSIAFVYLDTEYDSLRPLFEDQSSHGGTSVLVCPDTVPINSNLHDQVFSFPRVEPQRDELFFELYTNSVMNAY